MLYLCFIVRIIHVVAHFVCDCLLYYLLKAFTLTFIFIVVCPSTTTDRDVILSYTIYTDTPILMDNYDENYTSLYYFNIVIIVVEQKTNSVVIQL